MAWKHFIEISNGNELTLKISLPKTTKQKQNNPSPHPHKWLQNKIWVELAALLNRVTLRFVYGAHIFQ